MGREVRRVPAEWQHPRDAENQPVPLSEHYSEALRRWETEDAQWHKGFRSCGREDWKPLDKSSPWSSHEHCVGDKPRPEEYMPEWPEHEKTHFQMYENTTEGTPISPVMPTPEALARWLADTEASAFADMPASYEAWLNTIHEGHAPAMLFVKGQGFIGPGVQAVQARNESSSKAS